MAKFECPHCKEENHTSLVNTFCVRLRCRYCNKHFKIVFDPVDCLGCNECDDLKVIDYSRGGTTDGRWSIQD